MHTEVALPEGTVGRSPRHGAQEEGVDFDDLFDGSGGDVGAHGGTGVDADDDPPVEFEREGGGTLGEFDRLALVAVAACRGKVVSAKVRRISHIGNFEPTRLPQSETGDHGAASDRPFIALAVELL